MKKVIAVFLILVLIVSLTGCFQDPTPPPIEKDDEKIKSDEDASDKTAEIGDDLEGLSGTLKDLDDDLG